MKIVIFVIAWLFAAQLNAAVSTQPNLLLLVAEDMSSRVGAFGDSVAVTPNLDALAEQGVRYTNTFTTAGVCAPSRAAHILGVHQISTGTQHMRSTTRREGGYFSVPPEEVKAYPELLRAAGYYTFTDDKLDYQFSGVRAGSGPFTIWDAEGTADWQGRDLEQPFFGLINFQVTHETGVFTPIGSLPHSRTHLLMQFMRWWSLGRIETGVVKPDEVRLEPYYPDNAIVRADIARHYDNIAHMDREIGRILQKLEQQGLADSTIVIWTTDHGDGLPRAKRELFDSGIKVPMIIRWPEAYRPKDVGPGDVDPRLISFVDLAPTILALAGVTPPDYLQGRNFSSPDVPQRDYIYASRDRIDEVPDRQRAVRDARFKYIRSWHPDLPGGHPLKFRDNIKMLGKMRSMHEAGLLNEAQSQWFLPPGTERLFDLDKDPFELVDVSKDPDYRDELVRMRSALDRWLDKVVDRSDISETAMIREFYPGGTRPQTPSPIASITNGRLVVERDRIGSSYGYRKIGGRWSLYTEPVDVAGGDAFEVKAVRYGWERSQAIKMVPKITP
ncbi:MAG: sulfatase family protein [Pseudomonadales bacterium]